MTDIDAMLGRLRERPVHPELDAIDAAVMDTLAERARERSESLGARGQWLHAGWKKTSTVI